MTLELYPNDDDQLALLEAQRFLPRPESRRRRPAMT